MQEDALIEEHRVMVRRLAGQLSRELSLFGQFDDLVAFGFGGLLEAKHRFDPARGVRFETFAYHRVRGAMLDGVRKMAPVSRRAHEAMRRDAELVPTAAPTGIDRAWTRISASLRAAPQSRLRDPGPESWLIHQQAVRELPRALAALPERHRALIRGFYFEGRQLDDLAAELGISKSWASRLHRRALVWLRARLDDVG